MGVGGIGTLGRARGGADQPFAHPLWASVSSSVKWGWDLFSPCQGVSPRTRGGSAHGKGWGWGPKAMGWEAGWGVGAGAG